MMFTSTSGKHGFRLVQERMSEKKAETVPYTFLSSNPITSSFPLGARKQIATRTIVN